MQSLQLPTLAAFLPSNQNTGSEHQLAWCITNKGPLRDPRHNVKLHCDPPWRGASGSCLPLSALCNSLGMCCAAYVAVASPACPSNTAARETASCGATARPPAATPCSGCRAASTCLSSMRALRPGVCRAAEQWRGQPVSTIARNMCSQDVEESDGDRLKPSG